VVFSQGTGMKGECGGGNGQDELGMLPVLSSGDCVHVVKWISAIHRLLSTSLHTPERL
jgi:hypothetical protein